MKQFIFRATNKCSDIELLTFDKSTGKEYFSAVKLKEVIAALESFVNKEERVNHRLDLAVVQSDYIAIGSRCVVLKQPEHKRIVTYDGKAYKINFPNSIYFIDHNGQEVESIEAYCYEEYNGLNTKLLEYAMPNMLSGNKICIGSAPRAIKKDNIVETLEKIIFTQYTHSMVGGIKSFRETKKYFRYLSENEFPYKLLISAGKKLKSTL